MKKLFAGLLTTALVLTAATSIAFASGSKNTHNKTQDTRRICTTSNENCKFVDADNDGICDNHTVNCPSNNTCMKNTCPKNNDCPKNTSVSQNNDCPKNTSVSQNNDCPKNTSVSQNNTCSQNNDCPKNTSVSQNNNGTKKQSQNRVKQHSKDGSCAQKGHRNNHQNRHCK